MQDNSSKKNIEQQLYDLNIEPSQNVWIAVEKELDKKKRRYFFGWWWLLPLLLTGTGLIWYFNNDTKTNELLVEQKTTSPTAIKAKQVNAATQTLPIKEQPVFNDSASGTLIAEAKKDIVAGRNHPVKKTKKIINPGNTSEITGYRKQLSEKQQQKITVTPANTASGNDNGQDIAATENDETVKGDSLATVTQEEGSKKIETTSDSIVPTIAKKEKKKKISGWKKEWSVAGGLSSLTNFNAAEKAENFSYIPSGVGSSPGNIIRERNEYEFRKGIYVHAGLNIGRSLSKKLTWFTGLHYNYQSIQTSRKVYIDSLAMVGGSIAYTNVRSNGYSGTLNIHSIAIPLLLKFSFNKKFDINTGLYNSFSFSSNWNKYSTILGKQKNYLPVFHVNPSYTFNNVSIGPYLNVGLREYPTKQNLISYGLLLKYAPKK